MYAVEIKDVSKNYGSRKIFDHIKLNVNEGELVAVTGPSGCGKSTLLNMIGALESWDQGEIRVFGQPVPRPDSRKATLFRRNIINYLFQSFALVTDLTVAQNLMLAMHFVRIPAKEKEAEMNRILEAVHLRKLKNAPVNTLSGGEQQRVALARTMLKPGKLILADEPTGALDEQSAQISFNLLKGLCRKYKKTVIMVTHSMDLARQADRVVEIRG
ncbi:MAG TPA: ABC transporter ATP-binding protein [Candidatus Scybalocola faecigallinarum]|uniref:ABC transporter ATP-binding protein n=1 Tax=Candidatus Scybalocola faecigallinarum TaxID=2840941 RepID=A0A9D1JQ92_9FIRM|nr:ABC transporter ATP-binding protein [Candidatus Scybalocola faecigallinarum]